MWAFSASVGFILHPRLNGVLMALEGGGSGKVRVPVPGGEIGEKWGAGLQVGVQSGVTFSENWGYKTLAHAYRVRGGNEPKNGVKCRKLTLFVQLFRGCNLA